MLILRSMAWGALLLALIGASATLQSGNGEEPLPANIAKTDENGTFHFYNLSEGCYNLTAYRMILGAMHFLGYADVSLSSDIDNVTITVARSDEEHYACFQNASVNLTRGRYNLSGVVMGANRPGAEPKEIPYEDATVKITAFEKGI